MDDRDCACCGVCAVGFAVESAAAAECEPLSGGKPRCARDAGGKYICDNGCGCGYGFHPLGGDTDD